MPEKIYWFQTKSTGQNFEIYWSDLSDLSHVCSSLIHEELKDLQFRDYFGRENPIIYRALDKKEYLMIIRDNFY